ncbi:MAG: glycoside hydrolase family 44 protein [Chitinivibrionales bacterium]|nr:glycoside hydrolase family 44 protein [Chitinivibrionales bacterium]
MNRQVKTGFQIGCLLLVLFATRLHGTDFTFTIDQNKDTLPISPYVYGSNGFNDIAVARCAVMRQGGNRLTGYNWENNASNAGADYIHSSDGYLSNSVIPGRVLTDFVNTAKKSDQAALITLPMAGFVAADRKGTVLETEKAPSIRWKNVVFTKGAPFALTPDTADGSVYIDECVNHLVSTFGKAYQGGVWGYSLDNEPGLWNSTHPRIHPQKVGCGELIEKSIAVARVIKNADPSAQVSGPALFGYSAYYDLCSADDWTSVKGNSDWFISYYLDQMRKASQSYGARLLDILDLHWYPEAQGDGQRILSGSSPDDGDPVTAGAAAARMQAPRSLYDTTYAEDSWISKWMTPKQPVTDWSNPTPGPIKLLAHIQNSIDSYYPGTRIAFTEYSYGAPHHISGGIAQADFLGSCGKQGVFMTNKWYGIKSFAAAAFQIYRNYNGINGSFGDRSCAAVTSNRDSSCVYGGFSSNDPKLLHIIAINKASMMKTATMEIASSRTFVSGHVWGFDKNDTAITQRRSIIGIQNNRFDYSLPALSVLHFILYAEGAGIDVHGHNQSHGISLSLQKNTLTYSIHSPARISLTTVSGKTIETANRPAGIGTIALNNRASGTYIVTVVTEEGVVRVMKLLLL